MSHPIFEYKVIIEETLQKQLLVLSSNIKDAKDLLATLESDYKGILEALNAIKGEVKFVQEGKSIEQEEPKVGSDAPDGWEVEWTWETKIKKMIEGAHRALSTTEMADTIMKYEPWRQRNKIVGSISAVLSQKSKEGGLFSKKQDVRGGFLYTIAGSALDAFFDVEKEDKI